MNGQAVRVSFDACRQPTDEDRVFIASCNRLSKSQSSPGFGDTVPAGIEDPVPPSSGHCRRVLDFAQVAAARWPDFGQLSVFRRLSGATVVDHSCEFWRAGRKRYLEALARYITACRDDFGGTAEQEARRSTLLADLGFHVHGGFVSEVEEEELLSYWSQNGPVYALGSTEARTARRFFHYGPVLVRNTQGSTKSTLGIVPAQCGALPPPVLRMGLPARIRQRAANLGDRFMAFDQLYVNHYSSRVGARIDLHHDNPRTMRQVIAGVSLGGACELLLVAPDRELGQEPIRVLLPRCSLYLMSGLSRYHLQHGIPAVGEDRFSLTFRTLDRDCADRALWKRAWPAVSPEEADNAHWPLLPPPASEDEPQQHGAKPLLA